MDTNFIKQILGNDGTNGILQFLPGGSTVSNQYMPFIVGIYIIGLLPAALLAVAVVYILIGASKITRSEGDPKKHESGIVTVKRAVFAIAILFIIILLTNVFSLVILGESIYSAPNAFQVCDGTINGVSGNHLVLEYFRAGVKVPTTCVQGGKTVCQSCMANCDALGKGGSVPVYNACVADCNAGACSSGSTVTTTLKLTTCQTCIVSNCGNPKGNINACLDNCVNLVNPANSICQEQDKTGFCSNLDNICNSAFSDPAQIKLCKTAGSNACTPKG